MDLQRNGSHLPIFSGVDMWTEMRDWHDDKVKAARFGVQWLLPESVWRWARVRARDAALATMSA